MSRDVLVLGGIVNFIERGPNDVTHLPMCDPPDTNLICEEDWRALVGEPAVDEDGNPLETFAEREAAYIAEMGWTLAEQLGRGRRRCESILVQQSLGPPGMRYQRLEAVYSL